MAPSKARKVAAQAVRPPPHLSQEVIDLILVEVARKRDLAACSLVCRAWTFMARRVLFKSVSLSAAPGFTSQFEEDYLDSSSSSSDESAEDEASEHGSENSDEERGPRYQAFRRMLCAFARFLTTSSAPISATTTLQIAGEWDFEDGDGEYFPVQSFMLRKIVAAMPNLHTLALSRVNVRHCRVSPALTGSSLQTLIVYEVSGIGEWSQDREAVANFLQLFTIFPSLRELDFCGDDNRDCDEIFLKTSLENTALSRFRHRQRPANWGHFDGEEENCPVSHGFLVSLINASGKEAVHLDVEMVFPEESEGFIDSLLQSVGQKLESLVVRLWWGERHAGLGVSICYPYHCRRAYAINNRK